jgi:2-octaprenyl-6-methoxyphenol hydroxylase
VRQCGGIGATSQRRYGEQMQTDVIIVGGGLVGLTLAQALASAGLESAVVDAADLHQRALPAFDGRASAIASASVRMYQAIGFWPRVETHGQPIWEIRVTDGASPLFLHFDGTQRGENEPLGVMFENRRIRLGQLEAAANTPEIKLFAPDSLAQVERGPGRVTATLASGTTLTAPLIIACDGRKSAMRDQAGIRLAQWSYQQSAIITTVSHETAHGGVAHEMFHPEGPFAILPLTDDDSGQHRSSIVWTVDTRDTTPILNLPDVAFTAELKARFGDFMGDIAVIAPRWSYPLGFQHAVRYTDHRFALVGDSAHGIHPIAGQGLNMGLRDAAAMAEVLTDAARLGLDLGAADVLARYQRWRRTDNTIMSMATDGLNRLFSTGNPIITAARRIGLGAVHRLPPAKRFFMQQARGATGDMPKLLQGVAL